MKTLIIDTSSSNLFVATISNNEVKYLHQKGKNHSVTLMKAVKELMPIFDADEIIIGIGPGSYTGVRVGVTLAKVLAWSKKIPLKTISSLFLQASFYSEKRVSYLDARRGNVFSAIIENDQISNEAFRKFDELTAPLMISENEFKVDVFKVIKHAKLVENIHAVIPNYLQKTEAERTCKSE